MQSLKRRRFSPVFLILFLCYVAFSKMSYAQFIDFDPCSGSGAIFTIVGGCESAAAVEAPSSAPTSPLNSYQANSNFVLNLAPYYQPDVGFNLSLLVFLEVEESLNNGSYTKFMTVTPSTSGSSLTRQVSSAGTARYRYRACNSNECSEYSPLLALTITQPTTGNSSRRVVFLHTDALGSPAAETNENGGKQ